MDLRRQYRVMPLKQREVSAERLATWQEVRMETRSLVPLAMGAHGGVEGDAAFVRERVATPASRPFPQQPGLGARPRDRLQAAALQRRSRPTLPPHDPSPVSSVVRGPAH